MEYFAKGRRFLVRKANWLAALDYKELWQGWQSFRKFQRLTITGPTVLMVEPNAYHAEILPGFVDYFNQLGFKTVLICRKAHVESGAFCRVPESRRPIMLPMNPVAMKHCLKSKLIKRFDVFFLASSYLTVPYGFFGLFFDYLGFDPKGKNVTLLVEHVFKNILPEIDSQRFDTNQIFLLTIMERSKGLIRMLNPHYFGQVGIQALDSKQIVFITVGSITQRNKKSFEQLVQAVQYLENRGHNNFVIKVIGQGVDAGLFEQSSKHIQPLGNLDYPSMYSEVEKAHFFLPLLNPNIEGHREYLTDRTSGSRQLILGFLKVPVIHEKFAAVYDLTDDQALLHPDSGFKEAMLQAIDMDPAEYQNKVEALKQLKEKVYAESLENLRHAITGRR